MGEERKDHCYTIYPAVSSQDGNTRPFIYYASGITIYSTCIKNLNTSYNNLNPITLPAGRTSFLGLPTLTKSVFQK